MRRLKILEKKDRFFGRNKVLFNFGDQGLKKNL